MSPGRNHERIAAVINCLIVAYCEKYELQDFPFGQTRLNVWGQAGREPDLAYAFDSDKDLPDLVIEVVFSSGDIEILKSSYKNIGIAELWILRMETLPSRKLVPHSRWKENKITFYCLDGDNYTVLQASEILSSIESESFVNYVNRGLTESPLVIKKDFFRGYLTCIDFYSSNFIFV